MASARWASITRGFSRRCPTSSWSAIVDINEARAREIGGLVNAPPFTNASDVLGRVDAVTVAVPTESHLERRAAVSAARHRRAGGEAARAKCRRSAADDRCGRGLWRRVRRRAHGALQPGGRGCAAAARPSALHRGAPAGHVSRSQPRYRRRVRPHDSRPRRRAVDRAVRGRGGRGGRRRRADAEARYRERAAEVRLRVHREHHGEPHQQGSRAQDPDLSARRVSVGRLRGAGSRAMAAREGQRRDAGDRRRQTGDRAGRAAEARAGRLRRRRAREARAGRDRRGWLAGDQPRAANDGRDQ